MQSRLFLFSNSPLLSPMAKRKAAAKAAPVQQEQKKKEKVSSPASSTTSTSSISSSLPLQLVFLKEVLPQHKGLLDTAALQLMLSNHQAARPCLEEWLAHHTVANAILTSPQKEESYMSESSRSLYATTLSSLALIASKAPDFDSLSSIAIQKQYLRRAVALLSTPPLSSSSPPSAAASLVDASVALALLLVHAATYDTSSASLAEAMQCLRKALSCAGQPGVNTCKIETAANHLGLLLIEQGLLEEAEELLHRFHFEVRLSSQVLRYEQEHQKRIQSYTAAQIKHISEDSAPFVGIVDTALPIAMYEHMQKVFEPASTFWTSHNYAVFPSPSPYFSYLHPFPCTSSTQPSLARKETASTTLSHSSTIDQVIAYIHKHCLPLFPKLKNAKSVLFSFSPLLLLYYCF